MLKREIVAIDLARAGSWSELLGEDGSAVTVEIEEKQGEEEAEVVVTASARVAWRTLDPAAWRVLSIPRPDGGDE